MFICNNNCFNNNPLIKEKIQIISPNLCYKCIKLKVGNNNYNLFSNNYFSIEEIKTNLKEKKVIRRDEFFSLLNSLSIQLIEKKELKLTNIYNEDKIEYENQEKSFITENYKNFLNKTIQNILRISTKENDTHLVNYTGPVFNACRPCNFKKVEQLKYIPLEGHSNCIKLIINNLEKYFLTREKIINIKEIDEYLINNSINTEIDLLKKLKIQFNIEIFNIKYLDLTWIR